jgi:hypothetical protein
MQPKKISHLRSNSELLSMDQHFNVGSPIGDVGVLMKHMPMPARNSPGTPWLGDSSSNELLKDGTAALQVAAQLLLSPNDDVDM